MGADMSGRRAENKRTAASYHVNNHAGSSNEANAEQMKKFKVCLSGQKNVGKTSIFNALRGKAFSSNPRNEEQMHEHIVEVDGTKIQLLLWDTAGLEAYNSLTDNYYRGARAILEVYDVTDSESFLYVAKDAENIERCNYAPDSRFILVGNKIDKRSTDESVSEEKARNFIANFRKVRFDEFIQTSARTGEGVTELLTRIGSILIASNVTPVVEENTTELFQRRIEPEKTGKCCL